MLETTSRKVLIAEDSSAIQDLLKLILGASGHELFVAENGMRALDLLMSEEFDIAIMDFRLPLLNGLEVCTKYLFERDEGLPIPRFVCMTGNVDGFLSEPNAALLFDKVLGKPLDINAIVPLIESGESQYKVRRRPKLTDPAATHLTAGTRYYSNLNADILHFPEDFANDPLNSSVEARISLRGAPDAIVLTRGLSMSEADTLAKLSQSQITPIIDLSGRHVFRADIVKTTEIPLERDVLNLIEIFKERRERISRYSLLSEDIGIKVLLRIYALGGNLGVELDSSNPTGIIYQTLFHPAELRKIATRLCDQALLEKTYYDRLLACPNCMSTRISVREECGVCGSTDLKETKYVHHFRCAHMAPEVAFLHGDQLICPKCSRELKQYGEDYDKPGDVLLCNSCGSANSESNIGFRCFDCKEHFGSDDAIPQDIYSYRITEQGMERVIHGPNTQSVNTRQAMLTGLPMDILADINRLAGKFIEEQTDFCLICITFRNARAMEWQYGQNTIASAIKSVGNEIASSLKNLENWATTADTANFLFVNSQSDFLKNEVQKHLTTALSTIAFQFETKIQSFSPKDLI